MPRVRCRKRTGVGRHRVAPDGRVDLFPGLRSADRCRARAAAPSRRRRRARRIRASDTSGRWPSPTGRKPASRAAPTTSYAYKIADRRRTHHRQPPPTRLPADSDKMELWNIAADGSARAADQEQRSPKKTASSHRTARRSCSSRARITAGAVLQREPVSRARERRPGARADAGFSVRGAAGRMGGRQQVDLDDRQHRRAQRSVSGRPRVAKAAPDHERRSRDRADVLEHRRGAPRVHDRRAHANRRHLDVGARVAPLRPASRASTTTSIATSRCRARSRSNGKASTARASKACSPIRSTTSPARATRSWCSCTAVRKTPTDSDGGRSSYNYQPAWAARGYAMLRPNYRGSSGYGNAFYREPIGGYFKNSHRDVLAGVDRVIAMGVADPDRLAMMGWSAGGHLVNKLITFTTDSRRLRQAPASPTGFRCTAIRHPLRSRSLVRRLAMAEECAHSDVLGALSAEVHLGGPHAHVVPDRRERSARAVAQSIEMMRALKAQGVPSELHIAPGEGHIWLSPTHQLYKMNAEIEWFEKYVRHVPYIPETAPSKNDARWFPLPRLRNPKRDRLSPFDAAQGVPSESRDAVLPRQVNDSHA